MKVTVTKFLNVRVGKPSVNAPCYQYVAPGSEIETDGKSYKGDLYKGIDNWVRDLAGNYYWSGGVEIPQSTKSANDLFVTDNFWWLRNFDIDKLWERGLSGRGVKIAVLDSGLSLPHPDLIVEQENLKDHSKSVSGVSDKSGHGTHVTGIIKATNNGFGVKGIAFNSHLYFGKVTNDLKGDKIENLAKAVQWAVDENVDIISISIGFPETSLQLDTAINNAATKNILVVCAAGNSGDAAGANILYPAKNAHVLSVGGLTENNTPLHDTINTSQTNLFAPGKEILSTYLNAAYEKLSGSSQATPFVAAVACLILESKRKSNAAYMASQIKNDLVIHATASSFGKIINPLNTL